MNNKVLDMKGQPIVDDSCIFLAFPAGQEQGTGKIIFAKALCLQAGCRFYSKVAGRCRFELMLEKFEV